MTTFGSLEPLKDYEKIDRFTRVANCIIKYQKFKSRVAVANMKVDLKDNTKKNYFEKGIKYLNTGAKDKGYDELYKYIDEGVAKHIQPLTPSYSEKRRILNKPSKKPNVEMTVERKPFAEPVVAKESKVMTKLKALNKAIVNSTKYGVMLGQSISIADNEQSARAFLDGMRFAGCNEGKVISIEVKELE